MSGFWLPHSIQTVYLVNENNNNNNSFKFPIILIPGTFGSQLYCKQNGSNIITNSWLNFQTLFSSSKLFAELR